MTYHHALFHPLHKISWIHWGWVGALQRKQYNCHAHNFAPTAFQFLHSLNCTITLLAHSMADVNEISQKFRVKLSRMAYTGYVWQPSSGQKFNRTSSKSKGWLHMTFSSIHFATQKIPLAMMFNIFLFWKGRASSWPDSYSKAWPTEQNTQQTPLAKTFCLFLSLRN